MIIWGYCRYCNKEIETRDGRLLRHLETYQGPECRGSGQAPFRPPHELGAWEPVRAPLPNAAALTPSTPRQNTAGAFVRACIIRLTRKEP